MGLWGSNLKNGVTSQNLKVILGLFLIKLVKDLQFK